MDANEWDAAYAAHELVWGADPNRWVVAEVADLQPGRALDLACGEGRNAIWLAARGWQVTGADFSAVALSRAASLATAAGADIRWAQSDATDPSEWGGPFDLVLMVYLHLLSSARGVALRAAAKALAPGGTLLVIAHDLTNLTDGYGGPPDPAVLCTADDVLADLADVPGLVVERAGTVLRPVATPEGERNAIDVLVRVHRG